ncbi:MAG: hypothetical protein IGS39_04035 [Calothrix sp. C42_A2020_038]|nr:hypothetical protein [Calothrix sp. C42_A2020_038]
MLKLKILNYQKSLLSLTLLLVTTCLVATDSFTNLKSTQTFAQARVADFFSLWQRSKERRIARISRNTSICAITPGVLETYVVWHNRPIFIWKSFNNQEVQLILREYESQVEVWKQPINPREQKLVYTGEKALEAGKLYQWQLVNKSRVINESVTFQIMPEAERAKIHNDLVALEQNSKLVKSSPEEIALKKANYFLAYEVKTQNNTKKHVAWSDALQSLYEVKNPSPAFIEQREKFVTSFCQANSTIN